MSKPIGHRIKSVCTELERSGPRTSRQLGRIDMMGAEAARQYCLRALDKGFLTSDLQSPPVYAVVNNWRDLVASVGISKPREITVQKPVWRVRSLPAIGARNSVFDVRV